MTTETIIVDEQPTKTQTSPNTLAIQASKTARSKAEWLHMSITGEEEEGEGEGEGDPRLAEK